MFVWLWDSYSYNAPIFYSFCLNDTQIVFSQVRIGTTFHSGASDWKLAWILRPHDQRNVLPQFCPRRIPMGSTQWFSHWWWQWWWQWWQWWWFASTNVATRGPCRNFLHEPTRASMGTGRHTQGKTFVLLEQVSQGVFFVLLFVHMCGWPFVVVVFCCCLCLLFL